MKDSYGELCQFNDIETFDDACRWLKMIGVFAITPSHNVYVINDYDRNSSTCRLKNVDTSNMGWIDAKNVFRRLRGDTQGLDVFKDKLPEYFV